MDWLDLLAVQGTLKSLLQHHSSKASILLRSAFFTVQLSHPYMTTGKTIALTRRTSVGKVMSLLFNTLSRLVITSSCLSKLKKEDLQRISRETHDGPLQLRQHRDWWSISTETNHKRWFEVKQQWDKRLYSNQTLFLPENSESVSVYGRESAKSHLKRKAAQEDHLGGQCDQLETQGKVIIGQTVGVSFLGDPQCGMSGEHIQVLMKSTPIWMHLPYIEVNCVSRRKTCFFS